MNKPDPRHLCADLTPTKLGGPNAWRNRTSSSHASNLKRTVTPKRLPNADLRNREHLTEAEVELLIKATKHNRHGHRDGHACGYALANRGHDTRALQAYLGHRNIQHTVRYTELSPTR